MEFSQIFFFIFAALATAFAGMVVLKKNPVASAFSLIMVFFNFAAIYALQGAHLIAALQILVYAGAIMVLFIFVIMLLNADSASPDFGRSKVGVKASAALMCLVGLGAFIWAIARSPQTMGTIGPFSTEAIERSGGNTRVLSELLFSEYILPFELTSILLLAAIVAAVAIAKRKMGELSK